jgi:hypothetical protein
VGLADYDVATGSTVDPTTRFQFHETGARTIKATLISLLEKALSEPFPAESVLEETTVEVAAPARFAQPAIFLPALVVRRNAFLPTPEMLPGGTSADERALRETISRQIERAASLLPLRKERFLVGQEPSPAPEFQEIAVEFEKVLAPAAGAKTALRRNRFNEHELWFLPANSLPSKRAASPLYASARPLSTVRGDETFTVPDFNPDGPPPGAPVVGLWKQGFPLVGSAGFQKQDYDGLARSVFQFLERILTPRDITLAGEQMLWRQILAAKLVLARTLGNPAQRFLVPIFDGETLAAPGMKRMATDAFERSLSAFYAVDALAQFPVQLPPVATGITNYYGSIEAEIDTPTGPPAMTKPTYSDFVLSATFDANSESDRQAWLTLLYDMAPNEEDRWEACQTNTLTARITHVQLPVPGDAPAHEFDRGQWLKLAVPAELPLKDAGTALRIPVIMRSYPIEPEITKCEHLRPVASLDHLADWQWEITLLAEKSDADQLFFDIEYNLNEASPTVRGIDARRDDPTDWAPANLLQALIALDRLSVYWSKLRASGGDPAANALDAANALLAALVAELVGSQRSMREQHVVDKFTYKVTTGGPNEETVENPVNPRAKKATMAKDNDNTAADELRQRYKFTSPLNALHLFGPQGVFNYRPALSLKRNDNLITNRTTNPLLVYECGPVLWNTITSVTNIWAVPIILPANGSLTQTLEAVFGQIFHGADIARLAVRVDLWHVFENGPKRVDDPPAIYSVETRFSTVSVMASRIVESYGKALSEYGQALAVLRELTAPRLRIRLQVSQGDAPGQVEGRLLLDIAALEFDLRTITSL